MRFKANINQDTWSLINSFFSFKIKYTLEPLEANYKVGISRVKAYILLFKGRERGLVASISIR